MGHVKVFFFKTKQAKTHKPVVNLNVKTIPVLTIDKNSSIIIGLKASKNLSKMFFWGEGLFLLLRHIFNSVGNCVCSSTMI